MFRPMLRLQIVVDVVIAVLVGGFAIVVLPDASDASVIDYVAVGCLAVALAFRRMSPGLALALAWASAVMQMVALRQPNVTDGVIAAIMYTTSAYGGRRIRFAGLASAIVGSVTAATYEGLREYAGSPHAASHARLVRDVVQSAGGFFIVVLALLLLPWLGGLVVRSRSAARRSREAQLLAERDAARADRAVAVEHERLRIARDMHDIVAHSLAVVIAQADGARYALRADPGIADEALTTISSTARRALGDVRELLGALRHEQGVVPTADVNDIDRAVSQTRDLGVEVELDRTGDPSGLPTTTQLAVYRIVQEGLTNAYKHGDHRTPIRLAVSYGVDTVGVDVANRRADDGRSGPGTGHGLVGVRERATMFGGTMHAGPHGDDFLVTVRIPSHGATGQMSRGSIAPAEQEHSAP